MRASDVESESASQRWETDCRTRRKSPDGKAKNLIILQQDALFYPPSHNFPKFRMINFSIKNLTFAIADVANV